jgi:hypothetical protein
VAAAVEHARVHIAAPLHWRRLKKPQALGKLEKRWKRQQQQMHQRRW